MTGLLTSNSSLFNFSSLSSLSAFSCNRGIGILSDNDSIICFCSPHRDGQLRSGVGVNSGVDDYLIWSWSGVGSSFFKTLLELEWSWIVFFKTLLELEWSWSKTSRSREGVEVKFFNSTPELEWSLIRNLGFALELEWSYISVRSAYSDSTPIDFVCRTLF